MGNDRGRIEQVQHLEGRPQPGDPVVDSRGLLWTLVRITAQQLVDQSDQRWWEVRAQGPAYRLTEDPRTAQP